MLAEIERKYDPEIAFRPTGKSWQSGDHRGAGGMSVYHFYASGFGLVRELLHRGIYLSFVLGLVFLLFSSRLDGNDKLAEPAWYRLSGVAIFDIVLAVLAVAAALYLPLLPPEMVASASATRRSPTSSWAPRCSC